MGFLELNLFRDPRGAVLDPAAVVQKVMAWFPQMILLPGDQLDAQVKRAEAFEHRLSPEGARHILGSLRRKAHLYGPAYAFRIPMENGQLIQGRARRYDVAFLFEDPLPDDVRNHILNFLRSFNVGQIRSSISD